MNELIPIFPLEVVVYPGEALNLHIFETRYKQLINDCAETKMSFGIPFVIERKICELGIESVSRPPVFEGISQKIIQRRRGGISGGSRNGRSEIDARHPVGD
jgi:hypothetical protein